MAEPAAACSPSRRQGLDVLRLSLPCGDALEVALHGAQALSWVAGGRERLYLSPLARLDGQSAIRGGVPVCFPQFNQRGPLPKHGFARQLAWQAGPPVLQANAARLCLRLSASEATRALWPVEFEAEMAFDLSPGELGITLSVHNRGTEPLAFTGALHSYFAVDDISRVSLQGLEGQNEWDALSGHSAPCRGSLRIDGEHDRVYDAPPGPLTLGEDGSRLRISQSPAWAHTVVWNPGPAGARALADLPDDGFAHMLCVEAAQVFAPISLAPGASWQGGQYCTVN